MLHAIRRFLDNRGRIAVPEVPMDEVTVLFDYWHIYVSLEELQPLAHFDLWGKLPAALGDQWCPEVLRILEAVEHGLQREGYPDAHLELYLHGRQQPWRRQFVAAS